MVLGKSGSKNSAFQTPLVNDNIKTLPKWEGFLLLLSKKCVISSS
jgi:hypothetical protein